MQKDHRHLLVVEVDSLEYGWRNVFILCFEGMS